MRKTIRRWITILPAMFAVLVTGCLDKMFIRNSGTEVRPPFNTQREPDVVSLVNYLNKNAERVNNLRGRVDIQIKAGRQEVGVVGQLACAKPRDFRLKADVVGKPVADIGSNNSEFWYWMAEGDAPVYFCTYNDLAKGKLNIPFPFQPDMVISALGISEYDPAGKYELRKYDKTLELVQEVTSPSGEMVKRVTVFNRNNAAPGQPQVLAHALIDAKNKLICRATVQKVMVDQERGAVLPTTVMIEWPAQNLSMQMRILNLETNKLTPEMSARLFQRSDLGRINAVDLARNTMITPSSTRRAGLPGPTNR